MPLIAMLTFPGGSRLPQGAWVGTVSKLDDEVMGITSKYFFDFQLPAPPDVNAAMKEVFQ
jgi:hypothetical protein